IARGLDPSLARQVAEQLMVYVAIGAHARDEVGISETLRARPIHAALASAAASLLDQPCLFVHYHGTGGGLDPACYWNFTGVPRAPRGLAAHAGGTAVMSGAIRVTFRGALARGLT